MSMRFPLDDEDFEDENEFREQLKEVLDFYDFKKSRDSSVNIRNCLMVSNDCAFKNFVTKICDVSSKYKDKQDFIDDIKKIVDAEDRK